MIIDYPWYYVLFCLLAGAAYAAGLYYVGRRRFGKGVNALSTNNKRPSSWWLRMCLSRLTARSRLSMVS